MTVAGENWLALYWTRPGMYWIRLEMYRVRLEVYRARLEVYCYCESFAFVTFLHILQHFLTIVQMYYCYNS